MNGWASHICSNALNIFSLNCFEVQLHWSCPVGAVLSSPLRNVLNRWMIQLVKWNVSTHHCCHEIVVERGGIASFLKKSWMSTSFRESLLPLLKLCFHMLLDLVSIIPSFFWGDFLQYASHHASVFCPNRFIFPFFQSCLQRCHTDHYLVAIHMQAQSKYFWNKAPVQTKKPENGKCFTYGPSRAYFTLMMIVAPLYRVPFATNQCCHGREHEEKTRIGKVVKL